MRILGAALLALSFSGAVIAGCPGDAGEALPPREKLAVLEQKLLSLSAECGGRAGYLAYRGAVLNALGRPAEAALLLEQAILIEPQRAGAQIDYAEALAALGDGTSAAALLREVLARPDVPASIRPQLERRLNAIDLLQRPDPLAALAGPASFGPLASAGTGWQGSGTVTFKLGKDSNLNSAPARDALTLTLPGGDAVLVLADRFRPRSAAAARVEASGQMVRQVQGGAALQLYGDARLRDSPSASETDYGQVQAGGAWSEPLAGGEAIFSAGATRLRYGGAELYRALRLSASRHWLAGDCRPNLAVESEWRRYPAAQELEGRFFGVSAGVACSIGLDRLTLALRGGRDAAQDSRPGGDQRQTDARLAWSRPLAGGRIGVDLLWYHQQDAVGYSPLLANGASRRLNRASLYLEYAYPIAPGWSLLASFEDLLQRSRLDLFDISGRAVFLGVRWSSGR